MTAATHAFAHDEGVAFPRGMGRKVAFAALLSLLIHGGVLWVFHDVRLGFGPPGVDPYEPQRFHLQRATIDPRHLAPVAAQPDSPTRPPAQSDTLLDPTEIAAFSGPLNAPHIPTPTLTSEQAAPLSADTAPVPIDATTALPIESQGNLPSLAQALANEASTAALRETSDALMQNFSSLAGGGASDAQAGIGAPPKLPAFDDISALVEPKPPTDPSLSIPKYQPILLRLSSDVLFAFDSAELLPAAIPTLERAALVLRDSLRSRVTIEGHTDTHGTAEYNLDLSIQRASAVADWFAARPELKNIRFSVFGYGETRPLVSPLGSPEEQTKNRRVEIRLEAEK